MKEVVSTTNGRSWLFDKWGWVIRRWFTLFVTAEEDVQNG
jgi:hypothetical protein